MKNIHILPTSLPSRLGYLTKKGKEIFKDLRLFDRLMPNILDSENQNIYITNDDVIKAGDYFWKPDCNMIFKAEYTPHKGCEKVILTTDQDLIKDGVQSIDDEFLEWFVNNSSCEFVEVEKKMYMPFDGKVALELSLDESLNTRPYYKIIIPKEEPKQEVIVPDGYYDEDSKDFETASLVDFTDDEQESIEIMQEAKEMAKEKETLEEAAKKLFGSLETGIGAERRMIWMNGAKWQSEKNKKYIHKLLDIIQWYDNNSDVRPDLEKFEWYEQSKNK